MSEKDEAKRIGAKLVKNSGRGLKKGDFVQGYRVIDLKEVSKSFAVNMDVWAKVCKDSATYSYDNVPMLVIKFPNGVRLAIMDLDDALHPPL